MKIIPLRQGGFIALGEGGGPPLRFWAYQESETPAGDPRFRVRIAPAFIFGAELHHVDAGKRELFTREEATAYLDFLQSYLSGESQIRLYAENPRAAR